VGLGARGTLRTRRLGAVSGADWSGDGWPLTYVTDARIVGAERSSLWLLARLGGRPRRIATQRGEISLATISDDGLAIAYVLRRERHPWQSVWEVTGGEVCMIASNLLVSWMEWSPDHRWLAAIAVPRVGSRHNQLLLFGLNHERRVLVKDDVAAGAGSWSPDGKAVSYGTESETIRSIDLHTGQSDKFARFNKRIATSLLWAPDGKALAFTAQPIEEGD
jgi:Tol biopolymer transport system component